jgi:hypothetical protein
MIREKNLLKLNADMVLRFEKTKNKGTPKGAFAFGGAFDRGVERADQKTVRWTVFPPRNFVPSVTCVAWNASTACRWPKFNSPRLYHKGSQSMIQID